MTAGTRLQIATESPVTSFAESLAHFLAFFTRYQNIDCLSLPFLSFSRHL
jgi:hypothetical protein